MKKLNRVSQTLALVLLALPLGAMADSWSCRHGNDVREIHIVRESSAPVPCSVVYKKLTEGVDDQVLWTAENDANFCDQQAREFVAKQEGWGWTCVETIAEKIEDKAEESAEDSAAPAE